MAVSLAFGVLLRYRHPFDRPLVIVPALYRILMDLKDLVGHWAHERGEMFQQPTAGE